MEQGAGGAALYHEEFVGGLPHRGEHDDRPLLGEAEDEVGHLPHPLGRGHRRPAELHHDGEPRPRAPVAASLLSSGHRRILLLDNGGAGGSLAPDHRGSRRLPPARHGDRRRGPALPLSVAQPLLSGGGTVESQPRGGTESRRRRRRRHEGGAAEQEEEVEGAEVKLAERTAGKGARWLLRTGQISFGGYYWISLLEAWAPDGRSVNVDPCTIGPTCQLMSQLIVGGNISLLDVFCIRKQC